MIRVCKKSLGSWWLLQCRKSAMSCRYRSSYSANSNGKGSVQLVVDTRAMPADARVFSMVQPTGMFHLGNYLGATRVWRQLSDDKKRGQTMIFGVADLHAITVPKPDVSQFREYRMAAIASILSLGIDPAKCVVYFQSMVPEHSQLNWLLSTLVPMGQLNRMTQWKSKTKNHGNGGNNTGDSDSVKLGLFAYPVLQAADILLYRSTHVPVGEDQTQHLELARSVARKFNSMYKTEYFPEPRTLLTRTKKVLSLKSPEKKMSKSDSDQNSVIYVNDSPEMIQKKILGALTDSVSDKFFYDPQKRPGVSNLINIVSGIQNKSVQTVESEIAKFNTYKDFKDYVSEVIIEELREPTRRYEDLMKNRDYLEATAARGRDQAREIASRNLTDIMAIMGF